MLSRTQRTIDGKFGSSLDTCHQNIGITFMYREAVKKELVTGYFVEIPLVNFNIQHPLMSFT